MLEAIIDLAWEANRRQDWCLDSAQQVEAEHRVCKGKGMQVQVFAQRANYVQEFSLFLKKRATVEEEHCNGLKRLCRMTAENIRKPDQRHGTFLQNYEEMMMIHERMADNGQQFSISLSTMHDDLWELTLASERIRKHWKTNGLASEQRVSDAENALRKSKAKYDALADDYDRARTGDRQPGKKFGLKGPKSAAQHEEDLLRKVQAADADYASKVQTTQSMRHDLISKLRPEAVRALEDAIKEVDAGTTLQMQKFGERIPYISKSTDLLTEM